MWGINPLVPGWSTGPEKTRFPVCLLLPYIGIWFSSGLWYRADFEVPNPAAEKNVDTSRFSTRKPNPCNDHIYHSYASESLNLISFVSEPLKVTVEMSSHDRVLKAGRVCGLALHVTLAQGPLSEEQPCHGNTPCSTMVRTVLTLPGYLLVNLDLFRCWFISLENQ